MSFEKTTFNHASTQQSLEGIDPSKQSSSYLRSRVEAIALRLIKFIGDAVQMLMAIPKKFYNAIFAFSRKNVIDMGPKNMIPQENKTTSNLQPPATEEKVNAPSHKDNEIQPPLFEDLLQETREKQNLDTNSKSVDEVNEKNQIQQNSRKVNTIAFYALGAIALSALVVGGYYLIGYLGFNSAGSELPPNPTIQEGVANMNNASKELALPSNLSPEEIFYENRLFADSLLQAQDEYKSIFIAEQFSKIQTIEKKLDEAENKLNLFLNTESDHSPKYVLQLYKIQHTLNQGRLLCSGLKTLIPGITEREMQLLSTDVERLVSQIYGKGYTRKIGGPNPEKIHAENMNIFVFITGNTLLLNQMVGSLPQLFAELNDL
ncbi:MAG: hypothetical protein WAM28_06890 [Chlamydiales bacterium]